MSSSQPWCRLALLLLLFLPVFLLVRPSSASGQIRPGIERGDYWATVRAQYRSEVLEEVGGLMESWLTAWNNDDAESITEIFAEDGVLILDETRSAGGEAIQSAFGSTLPEVGAIEYSLIDFDVRGEMAFVTTRFSYADKGGVGGSSDVTGHQVWILIKHDGGWKIRSQIFQRSRE